MKSDLLKIGNINGLKLQENLWCYYLIINKSKYYHIRFSIEKEYFIIAILDIFFTEKDKIIEFDLTNILLKKISNYFDPILTIIDGEVPELKNENPYFVSIFLEENTNNSNLNQLNQKEFNNLYAFVLDKFNPNDHINLGNLEKNKLEEFKKKSEGYKPNNIQILDDKFWGWEFLKKNIYYEFLFINDYNKYIKLLEEKKEFIYIKLLEEKKEFIKRNNNFINKEFNKNEKKAELSENNKFNLFFKICSRIKKKFFVKSIF